MNDPKPARKKYVWIKYAAYRYWLAPNKTEENILFERVQDTKIPGLWYYKIIYSDVSPKYSRFENRNMKFFSLLLNGTANSESDNLTDLTSEILLDIL